MRKGENIYKRKDGRWEGRYIKGRTIDHRIIYGYVYGKQYLEVKEKLAVKKAQYISSNKKITSFSGTLEQWFDYWLDILMKSKIKASSYSNYKGKIDKYILPYLGKKKLSELKSEDIESFIHYLNTMNLAGSTIRSIVAILKSSLKKAEFDGKIASDPCTKIVLPTTQKTEISALTLYAQKRLEQAALKKKECSGEIIALYTGMRIGEISGLKWSDIDMEKDIIHVRRTISRIPSPTINGKTEIMIDTPKTKSSLRVIPLAVNLKEYLMSWKKDTTSEYVVNCRGSFTEPRIINYRFKKNVVQAQIDDIHFHTLRHTFATRCVEEGIDIATLSKILGHSSIKMTLDTYTDSLWENRKAAISIIDKRLSIHS
ncbi:hypothetical protein DOK67_0001199 [Enterococcus sp. DIV0212c]|uniref:tyrosine-type recombinase/integrase n=1 Tax=Enterococcus sp. DIV0212c TaxID=2230867 RepID=UPI001A9B0025|nr:site-specific integrase [Enterococcus sp. DIV0212c]